MPVDIPLLKVQRVIKEFVAGRPDKRNIRDAAAISTSFFDKGVNQAVSAEEGGPG